jgi:hypothetical protein
MSPPPVAKRMWCRVVARWSAVGPSSELEIRGHEGNDRAQTNDDPVRSSKISEQHSAYLRGVLQGVWIFGGVQRNSARRVVTRRSRTAHRFIRKATTRQRSSRSKIAVFTNRHYRPAIHPVVGK